MLKNVYEAFGLLFVNKRFEICIIYNIYIKYRKSRPPGRVLRVTTIYFCYPSMQKVYSSNV